ncbi:MAG: DUF748 domain-containing protein [Thermodesulfobacteriota bacterium]|nr:DUF748 domain-containing protein [Thermodesulfobacteriota bacterium]
MVTPKSGNTRLKKITTVIALLLGIYALAGFIGIPLVMEAVVPGKLSGHLNRRVTLENIALNPFFLTLTVEGLKIAEAGTTDPADDAPPWAQWERLFVNVRLFSGIKPVPGIKTLQLTTPTVRITRQPSGTFNVADLLTGGKAADEDMAGNKPEAPQSSENNPFIPAIDTLKIINGRVSFIDHAAPGASDGPAVFTLENMNLRVTGFSPEPETVADTALHFRLDPSTAIDLTGTFDIMPLAANAHLAISDLEVPLAQPYIPPSIRLQVTEGSIDISADIQVKTDPETGLCAIFEGKTGFRGLTVVEREKGEPFFALDELTIKGIRMNSQPMAIHAEQILLAGVNQRITINQQGELNLARAFQKKSPASAETETESTDTEKEKTAAPASKDKAAPENMIPFPVDIGEVVLRDIATDFTDKNIEPNFAARLTLAEGRIEGLTSRSFSGADMMIKGALDRHAPLSLSGKINPFLQNILLDAAVRLHNMELSSISPYTGKYIGRAIEQGKLNLNLAYTLRDQALTAENHILLDQFTLGKKIQSPAALNLPVGLAVALLKDRQGEINLDIPVSGRLDNPEFSVAAIVLQALKNILVKAAASPFDLVASLVDGGEELRFIAFDAGTTRLTEQAREKLKNMDELLYKRPALRLEISGCVDPVEDRNVLTRTALERRLKKMKWRSMDGNQKKDAADDITLSPAEYNTYLQTLYKQTIDSSTGTDQQVADGRKDAAKSDPKPDRRAMETALLEQLRVKDAELLLLARDRARAVKNHLIGPGRVEPARLFILDSRIITEPSDDAMPPARVTLGLR